MADASYHNDLEHRIRRLDELRGEAMLLAIREIVEAAKSHGDGDTVAEFANHLVEAASQEGRLDYQMIGFGELKALYGRDPRFADLRDSILWYYKWIAEHLAEHVEVPRDQIEETFAGMEEFYRAAGEGLRPVYSLRCRAAALVGDAASADRFAELWRQEATHESDDCPACETHARVQYLLDVGRIPDAIQVAAPILQGEQFCEEVPATTFSRLMMPLLLVDKPDAAFGLGAMVRRQVRKVPKLLSHLADHVLFLSVVGDLTTARRLTLVMTARAEKSLNTNDRFHAWRAAWVFASRWKRDGGTQLMLPAATELGADEEPVAIDRVTAHHESRTRDLARRFDARNDTARFRGLVDEAAQLAGM